MLDVLRFTYSISSYIFVAISITRDPTTETFISICRRKENKDQHHGYSRSLQSNQGKMQEEGGKHEKLEPGELRQRDKKRQTSNSKNHSPGSSMTFIAASHRGCRGEKKDILVALKKIDVCKNKEKGR
jgi:hypothetical protein